MRISDWSSDVCFSDLQRSRNPLACARSFRYSGRYRPAWLISQTGGLAKVSPCRTCSNRLGVAGVGFTVFGAWLIGSRVVSVLSSGLPRWLVHPPEQSLLP